MVSQCANPACGANFLYFGEGQLITVRRHTHSSTESTVEFFWLCGECASRMNLEVESDGEMSLVPRTHATPACSPMKEVGYDVR